MVNSCETGMIRRKGYTRADGVVVKSTCVTDMGAPGKGAKVLPIPKKGSLGDYGYHNVKETSAVIRHKVLRKAVADAGYATIIKRINLIANYNKNNTEVHKILRRDIKWIQKNLACEYAKQPPIGCGSKRGSKVASKRVSKRTSKRASKRVSKRVSKKASKRKSILKKPGSRRGRKKASKRVSFAANV